ncbi:hypothetical protein KCMC57_up49000 [Kitasatospora sp. CMC57]|uniref:Secreted protein n=1 Tax=Kitasatospora sp. CMC57 TaxID=3231513 RepID=A0AB33K4W2_9ACTN
MTHLLLAHRLLHLLLLAHRLQLLLLVGLAHRAALTGRELRRTGGQAEGLVAHLLLHLLLARDTGALLHLTLAGHRRAGYGGGDGSALAAVLRLLLLAHVGLVLRGGTSGRGELGPQVLVLAQESGQLCFDLVEEGIDLVLVIAFTQPDGRELLVPNVLWGQ